MIKKALNVVKKVEQLDETKDKVNRLKDVQNQFKDYSSKEKIMKFNEDYRGIPNKEEGNALIPSESKTETVGNMEVKAPVVEKEEKNNLKGLKDITDHIPKEIPLNVPKGAIAMILLIILFILFAIMKVETKSGERFSRLGLMWRSLVGKTTLINEEFSKKETTSEKTKEVLDTITPPFIGAVPSMILDGFGGFGVQ